MSRSRQYFTAATRRLAIIRRGDPEPFFHGFLSLVSVLLRGVEMSVPRQRSCSPVVLFPTEATMSAKKRRKIYGVRRETRRPRGWTRWFQEGLFETESANSIRLRTVLWGPK